MSEKLWWFYLKYWRRYAGWFPIQLCMICGKPYWGGLPRPRWLFGSRCWEAAWMDYCSQECCDEDGRRLS